MRTSVWCCSQQSIPQKKLEKDQSVQLKDIPNKNCGFQDPHHKKTEHVQGTFTGYISQGSSEALLVGKCIMYSSMWDFVAKLQGALGTGERAIAAL